MASSTCDWVQVQLYTMTTGLAAVGLAAANTEQTAAQQRRDPTSAATHGCARTEEQLGQGAPPRPEGPQALGCCGRRRVPMGRTSSSGALRMKLDHLVGSRLARNITSALLPSSTWPRSHTRRSALSVDRPLL